MTRDDQLMKYFAFGLGVGFLIGLLFIVLLLQSGK